MKSHKRYYIIEVEVQGAKNAGQADRLCNKFLKKQIVDEELSIIFPMQSVPDKQLNVQLTEIVKISGTMAKYVWKEYISLWNQLSYWKDGMPQYKR